MKLLVLVGIPASGKSYWAKNFVKANSNWARVNRDSIRSQLGVEWDEQFEKTVVEVEKQNIKALNAAGFNVIVDDTNLSKHAIGMWRDYAKQLDMEFEVKYFYISKSTALLRNKLRYDDRVPDKVINEMYEKMINIRPNPKLGILPKAIIFDIDGTLALKGRRNPFDETKVMEDEVNHALASLVRILLDFSGIKIFFFSGRKNLEDTNKWLKEKVFLGKEYDYSLHTRSPQDNRPDTEVKKEMFNQVIGDDYQVIAVFDDRQSVVDMWRFDLGLPTYQVWYGEF